VEQQLLGEFDGWVVIPLVCQMTAKKSYSGDPSLPTNELATIDDVNRLLMRRKETAINIDDPSLKALDLALPREPGDEGA
jgi:hypothetical protein